MANANLFTCAYSNSDFTQIPIIDKNNGIGGTPGFDPSDLGTFTAAQKLLVDDNLANAATNFPNAEYLVWDLEGIWATEILSGWAANPTQFEARVQLHVDVYNYSKTQSVNALPNVKIGFYGLPWQKHSGSQGAGWVQDIEKMQPIWDAVDVLYPSLYYHNQNNIAADRLVNITDCNKAIEKANGKELLLFMWHRYHSGSGSLFTPSQTIPEDDLLRWMTYSLEESSFGQRQIEKVVLWDADLFYCTNSPNNTTLPGMDAAIAAEKFPGESCADFQIRNTIRTLGYLEKALDSSFANPNRLYQAPESDGARMQRDHKK